MSGYVAREGCREAELHGGCSIVTEAREGAWLMLSCCRLAVVVQPTRCARTALVPPDVTGLRSC
jgi:hypothetical protein